MVAGILLVMRIGTRRIRCLRIVEGCPPRFPGPVHGSGAGLCRSRAHCLQRPGKDDAENSFRRNPVGTWQALDPSVCDANTSRLPRFSRACVKIGNRIAASKEIIAITTSNSISVKAARRLNWPYCGQRLHQNNSTRIRLMATYDVDRGPRLD